MQKVRSCKLSDETAWLERTRHFKKDDVLGIIVSESDQALNSCLTYVPKQWCSAAITSTDTA